VQQEEFLASLNQDGFPEPILVKQLPNGNLSTHHHDFEVRALVIKGSIKITINDKANIYLEGQVFHLAFQEAHSEQYGPFGVIYLASRKLK
jgi:hypothetical protein